MKNQDKYNFNNVRKMLADNSLILLENKYINAKTKMLCKDTNGYYIYIRLSNFLSRNGIGRRFDKSNPYTIENINHYLKLNNVHFKCISTEFHGACENLKFQCTKCGTITYAPWRNVNKNDKSNRTHIICPKCDGRIESLHALVLKQMFLHYYPDTSVEDCSYVSPITGKICPTDIVNHRLKIAIEVQSQWHDFELTKLKDKLKKNYWVSIGYQFYDPDIRNYSVLEMCQLFFNITSIPSWIDYNYSNKLNLKKVQDLINDGFIVPEVANLLNVNKHRIYDAIYNKKIFYPSNYKNITKQKYII